MKDKGLLNEVDVNAFNKMRNKLAHNTADYNNGIELGYTDVIKLKVLVHKMIFILINYQGSYINYNLPNYPNENLRSIL